MNKKILLLGGSYGQIPAIEEAKRRGLYTILCDYLPDNPGQHFVDEFHLISTTDKEKVFELAQGKQIDCVLAYGSDPAVLTSAYVSTKMGLKGNSPESIELLSHKDLFRKFQKENGFQAPQFMVITDQKSIPVDKMSDLLPVAVKPVDSSDTKGVTLVEKRSELNVAIERAFNFTRCGRVIIEKKVDDKLGNLHGDGFVIDGELRFCELGDHIYNSLSDPLKPSSTLFPSRLEKKQVQYVKNLVAEFIRKTGYQHGPVNIEVRINSEGDIYIMEIGPRNGGSYIPQTIYHSTGFNMVEALFNQLLGEEVRIPNREQNPAICFTLHSNTGGIFDSFRIDNELESFLVEKHMFAKPGDPAKPYNNPGSSLGALVFRFKNEKQVNKHLDNFYHKVIDGVQLKGQIGS